MKLITINVTDEEHKAIKTAAAQAGLSMKEHLLGATPRVIKEPRDVSKTLSAESFNGFCKHGYAPTFCKHAKGGKPCK